MYIEKIILKNFKSFIGDHELKLSEGINFFVGNNNCGKTTIFKAIEFLQFGKNKEECISKGKESEELRVEIELKGSDLKDIINNENFNLKKYLNYIIDNKDGTHSLRILRSSLATSLTQGKKSVNLDIRNIRIYNPELDREIEIENYENPTGIDKTITALFDAQFVYSDLKNEEYQDFGKTKVIGKIINDVTKDFQKEVDEHGKKTVWAEFKEAHKKTFGDKGLLELLNSLEKSIQGIMSEQYGEVDVKFNFGLPEIDNFFKTGNIILSDNGISTPVSQKGTGMQRALALSLIQLYAKINNKSENNVEKPIIFFIDEPETFLHPKAQHKLIDSLCELSNKSQVFITTHSPYLLKSFDNKKHQLSMFLKKDCSSTIHNKNMANIFGSNSPTWGEINYFAFEVPSVEFHNELYGFLQGRAIKEDEKNYSEKNFDEWLREKGIEKDKEYVRLLKDGSTRLENKTLPTVIRNIIHHPENIHNSFHTEELEISIKKLISVIENEGLNVKN